MKNSNMPAMPIRRSVVDATDPCFNLGSKGLTKREDFAKTAMLGLLVNIGRNGYHRDDIAGEALSQADELLKALDGDSE